MHQNVKVTLSLDHKQKISKSRKYFLQLHPEMHPNKLCKNKKSYWQNIMN